MGVNFAKMALNKISDMEPKQKASEFKFHDIFLETEETNGLCLSGVYFPEEVMILILSYIDVNVILKASLVCRKWCNIIKSPILWSTIYSRTFPIKPKKLPWYVYYCYFTTDYFNKNLLMNGNGQYNFNYWKIIKNYGDEFKIEDPPAGADPLPVEVPDFNGYTSCFATSFYECNKLQEIFLNNRLLRYILNHFKPHIYVSEWVAGRFDCGCIYHLTCKLFGEEYNNSFNSMNLSNSDIFNDEIKPLLVREDSVKIVQWGGSSWSKVEILIEDYPEGVETIIFQHEGRDTQFWKGHYGSKMAGGVVKILFDTIE